MVNKELKIITKIHNSTKRNYLERMVNSKVKCMLEAKNTKKIIGMVLENLVMEDIATYLAD